MLLGVHRPPLIGMARVRFRFGFGWRNGSGVGGLRLLPAPSRGSQFPLSVDGIMNGWSADSHPMIGDLCSWFMTGHGDLAKRRPIDAFTLLKPVIGALRATPELPPDD
jgi:hypothetical protein